jgi:hypothetical protein
MTTVIDNAYARNIPCIDASGIDGDRRLPFSGLSLAIR